MARPSETHLCPGQSWLGGTHCQRLLALLTPSLLCRAGEVRALLQPFAKAVCVLQAGQGPSSPVPG